MSKIKKINPLVEAMKTKNVFVRIPSNGILEYDHSIFSTSTKDEIGITGRSSKDELRFHVPDALMNGKAVSECIESCVEEVNDADGLYLPDVYTLLLGIKLASGEKTYDIEAKCPNCEKKGSFTREIEPLLDDATLLYEEVKVDLDNGITIYLAPNTWGFYNSVNERLFRQQYMLKVITDGIKSNELDEKDAVEQVNKIYENLLKYKHDLIANCIRVATLPDGREIDDKEQIREFVDCFTTEQITLMKEKIDFLNNKLGIDETFPVVCSDCAHEWDITKLEYDPSIFFGRNFSTQTKAK